MRGLQPGTLRRWSCAGATSNNTSNATPHFYQLLRDGAHNPKLAEDLGRLRDEILLVLRSVSSQPGAMGRGVLHDHNAILNAILRSSPDDAERAARHHVQAVLRFVLDSTFEAAIK